jgi:hypothetical protein
MMCISDLSLSLVFGVFLSINVFYKQVPSNFVCQAQGVAIHFLTSAQIATITVTVYDRYKHLCELRDKSSSTKSLSTTSSSPTHWLLYKYAVLPLLLLHAFLPVLTSSKYGIYFPKPNNAICFAGGGRGILAHDMFGVVNTGYFLACFPVVVIASLRSLKIIRGLLASNTQSTTAVKRVEAERRVVWFTGSTTLLFATGEPPPSPVIAPPSSSSS